MYIKLILPTINLINYYNSIGSSEIEHYMQLLLLLSKGLKLYATENDIDISLIKEKMVGVLSNHLAAAVDNVFDD